MIALAYVQYMAGQGLANVADTLGDHRPDRIAFAVFATPRGGDPLYSVALQLRCRADDRLTAERELGRARELLLATRYSTVRFVDPDGQPDRVFHVKYIEEVTRPAWYPTPGAGEEASCNFTLYVSEP
jgi:hypothetical protein